VPKSTQVESEYETIKGKLIAFLSSTAVNPEGSICISEDLWILIFGVVGIKPHKNRDKPRISGTCRTIPGREKGYRGSVTRCCACPHTLILP